MLVSEQRLGIFHGMVKSALSGNDRHIHPMHVVLPDGTEADAALKIKRSRNWDRLIISALVCYSTGRVAGERHTQFFAPDPKWMDGHEHGGARCDGFEFDGEQFVQSQLDRRPATDQYASMRERALDIAGPIIRGLMTSESYYNVFGPDGAEALRYARSLHGNGPENPLLVDAALRYALDKHLGFPRPESDGSVAA